ncbi:MAG TPA: hypothetical protein VIW69_03425 [Candidatus Elarobacter sp.]
MIPILILTALLTFSGSPIVADTTGGTPTMFDTTGGTPTHP